MVQRAERNAALVTMMIPVSMEMATRLGMKVGCFLLVTWWGVLISMPMVVRMNEAKRSRLR